jgi:hypothetical protein|nr:MAG TPA: hypothetical protein [Caudoviricetes sp.]
MTKEQEEIIQRVNSDIDSPLSGGYTTIVLTDDLEEILNMLKEKDAEIEKYKKLLADNLAKGLNNSLQAKQKANTDLEDLNEGWKIELKKKDKVIDLMAKYIADIDNEDICFEIENKHCDKNMDYGECEDCIKQYFERKATNDG